MPKIKTHKGSAKRLGVTKNGKIKRRFGDRRTIHPDDYPKLTKVFENIETSYHL